MPLLPSQRGPKAIISLVYCMARAASRCKAGPAGSTGLTEAPAGDGAAACVDEASPVAEAALSLEHPNPARDKTRMITALRFKHKITPALLAAQISDTTSPV